MDRELASEAKSLGLSVEDFIALDLHVDGGASEKSISSSVGPRRRLRCDLSRGFIYCEATEAEIRSQGKDGEDTKSKPFRIAFDTLQGQPEDVLYETMTALSPEDIRTLRTASSVFYSSVNRIIATRKRSLLKNSLYLSQSRADAWEGATLTPDLLEIMESLGVDEWLRFYYRLVYFPYNPSKAYNAPMALKDANRNLTWRAPYVTSANEPFGDTRVAYGANARGVAYENADEIRCFTSTLNLALIALPNDDVLLLHGVNGETHVLPRDAGDSAPVRFAGKGFSFTAIRDDLDFQPFLDVYPFLRFRSMQSRALPLLRRLDFTTAYYTYSHHDLFEMAILTHKNKTAAYIANRTSHLDNYDQPDAEFPPRVMVIRYAQLAAFAQNDFVLQMLLERDDAAAHIGLYDTWEHQDSTGYTGFWSFLTEGVYDYGLSGLGFADEEPMNLIDIRTYRNFLIDHVHQSPDVSMVAAQRNRFIKKKIVEFAARALEPLLSWILRYDKSDPGDFKFRTERIFGTRMIDNPVGYFNGMLRTVNVLLNPEAIFVDAASATKMLQPNSLYARFVDLLRIHVVGTVDLTTFNATATAFESKTRERFKGAAERLTDEEFFVDAF